MRFEGLDLATLIILVATGIVYFMPWFVAVLRDHQQRFMVGLLNLLLGWTLIGWVVAFLWATFSQTQTGALSSAARRKYA